MGSRDPTEPALEERSHPWLATRCGERGAHNVLHEYRRAMLEHLDLQRFFGVEMGEQPALGKLEIGGELPDGEPSQTDLTRQPGGAFENHLPGRLALRMGK
jgi:hypothetical protein